jgi:DNA-binding GntR family transcriptional regulator
MLIPALEEPPLTGTERHKVTRVTERIREMILTDELLPGRPIRERTLAEKLNVSRTPMREALKVLAGEGLVELHPNRGASVAAPTRKEIFNILQFLSVVEGFAAELACENITDEEVRELWAMHYEMLACRSRGDKLGYFHRNQAIHSGIVAASRNEALIESFRVLNARVYRIRFILHRRAGTWDDAIRVHESILKFLERRDAASLGPLQRQHVFSAWELLGDILPAD